MGQIDGLGERDIDDDGNLTEKYSGINAAIKTHLRNDLARSDSLGLEVNTLDNAILDDEGTPIDNIIGRRLDPINRAKINYFLMANEGLVNQQYILSRVGYNGNGFSKYGEKVYEENGEYEEINTYDIKKNKDRTKKDSKGKNREDNWTKQKNELIEDHTQDENTVFTQKELSKPIVSPIKTKEYNDNWMNDEFESKDSDEYTNESAASRYLALTEKKKKRFSTMSAAEKYMLERESQKIIVHKKSAAEEFAELVEKRKRRKIKKIYNVGRETAQGKISDNTHTIEDKYIRLESEKQKDNKDLFLAAISEMSSFEILKIKETYLERKGDKTLPSETNRKLSEAIKIIDNFLQQKNN